MILDSETNFLYLADTLPNMYPNFYKNFKKSLIDNNVEFELLPNTKDIWAVDYMPIQIETNNFVQFVYNPYYLQSKKNLKTISDVDTITKHIDINTTKTNIIIDGGNLIHYKNSVIMTTRIFRDNINYDRKKLLSKIQDLLYVDKIYLIPEQPGDFTGHADGMVRFINNDTILINEYDLEKENKWFIKAFEIAIHNTGLNVEKIPYFCYNQNTNWANGNYINYLQMKNLVFVPTYNKIEDDIVLDRFKKIFKDSKIVRVKSNEIAEKGGVLNCISWNIKK